MKWRSWSSRIANLFIALVMVLGMVQFTARPVSVGATSPVGGLTLYVADKAGNYQQVGAWSYDNAGQTLRDSGGTEASFITNFGDNYLRYSGVDMFQICSRMAVCKKGILLSDLLAYASSASGVPFNSETVIQWGQGADEHTYGFFQGRYYYPSYVMNQTFDESTRVAVPTVFAIISYNQRNLAGSADNGWSSNPTLTELNGGVEVPVAVDEASMEHAFGILSQAADDARSLRVILGQNSATPGDLNLGRLSIYNIPEIDFTPVYLDISTDITNDDGSAATATIAIDDGYLKAAAGEAVSFTLYGITSGYGVDSVIVTDSLSNQVTVSQTGADFSFTMPETAATIHVALKKLTSDCTVTYASDGTTYTTFSAQSGLTIFPPTAPTKTNCTFDGWYADEELAAQVSFPYTVTGDTTLYAGWISNKTVTFISDGVTYTTVSVSLGSATDAPAVPLKNGYIFDGWYADEGLTVPVSFPYTVIEDTTFYARWNTFDFNFTLSGDTATITGYTGSGGDVVIPGTITAGGKNYAVKTIGGSAFWGCTSMISVTIPDTVISMGAAVFTRCENLTSATLGNGITSVPMWCFDYCSNLSSVTIPDGITGIGFCVFWGCWNLTSLNIPDSVTEIDANAFAKSGLTSLTIPAGVTSIGKDTYHGENNGYVFGGCSYLSSVYFLGLQPDILGDDNFNGTAAGFTIYYHISQAASWESFTDYPSAPFCTLTLDTQNGNAQTSSFVTVTDGHIAAPSDPARPGYIFSGWYKEAACINTFNFSSQVVANDVKLYAKWNTPDLNGDHVIDVSDLVSIGLHWGQVGTAGWVKEDLNRDGIIDVCDLVQIGLYWGRSY